MQFVPDFASRRRASRYPGKFPEKGIFIRVFPDKAPKTGRKMWNNRKIQATGKEAGRVNQTLQGILIRRRTL